jgi:hypothetical protein
MENSSNSEMNKNALKISQMEKKYSYQEFLKLVDTL